MSVPIKREASNISVLSPEKLSSKSSLSTQVCKKIKLWVGAKREPSGVLIDENLVIGELFKNVIDMIYRIF